MAQATQKSGSMVKNATKAATDACFSKFSKKFSTINSMKINWIPVSIIVRKIIFF